MAERKEHLMELITPFLIPSERHFDAEIPANGKILTITIHEGKPYMWIQHDPVDILSWRSFILSPGGDCIGVDPMSTIYVGSFKTKQKPIFLFERIIKVEP
jgi:hypothetical protein